MTARQTSRIVTSFILAILYFSRSSHSFTVPDVTIEVFTPKGLRVSIPDIPGTNLFVFEGNVDKVKKNFTHRDLGSLRGWIRDRTEGRWVFTDLDTKLSLGDVINYYVYVTDMKGLKENLSFTVSEIVCQPSVTKVKNRKVCPGETIFEEHFSLGQLGSDLWQIEQYLPIAHPDYPFVSYQRSQVMVTEQGHLRIAPKLQETMPGFTNDSIALGKLDLFKGCTANAEACYRQAPDPDIVPPVISGRVRSRNFAFKYGSVLIRAKLPQGDWIYPEILLEPFLKKYGRASYASGLIKIVTARGNKQLRRSAEEYGNQVLYGGPVMDYVCRDELIKNKIMTNGFWGDDFHNFSVSWTPVDIKLSVDGEEWVHVDVSQPLHDQFPQRCSHLPRELYAQGTELAPFDDYFYLTFGVSVGGSSEFPDDSYSDGKVKPWRNAGRKAMLNFWRDLNSWHKTWSQPELLIDFVKVVAL